MKALNADPKFAAAHSERMKAMHADPKFAAAHSARNRQRMKAMHADPKFAAAHSERMKALHAAGRMRSDRVCSIGGCEKRLAKINRSGVCNACRRAGANPVIEAAQ